jgi:hypothetical protein
MKLRHVSNASPERTPNQGGAPLECIYVIVEARRLVNPRFYRYILAFAIIR